MIKKIASLVTVSLLLITPLISSADTTLPDDYGSGSTTSAGVYCPHLSVTLQRNSRDATSGGQVSELQAFLTDYYNLADGLITGGFFGRLTQKYVIQFQSEQGLPVFGIVGMLTRAKIANVCGGALPPAPISVVLPVVNEVCNANTTFTTNLQVGSNDPQVAAMRLFLTASLGTNGTYFDSALVPYVQAFQQKYAADILTPVGKTAPDGVWGPAERAKANAINAQCKPITNTSGTLSISTDASTPGYQIVSGGTTGVVLGTFKFHANGEAITLQKISVALDDSVSPNDLAEEYIYDGSTLVGTATITAGNHAAMRYYNISTLTTPVTITANSDKVLTIKGDIAGIGTGQAGHSGDLLKIGIDNANGVGVNSGAVINLASTNGAPFVLAGVRIFKSYPTVTLDSLNSTNVDFSTAKQPALIRFKVTASPSGPVSFTAIQANFVASGITFSSVAAYGYTDAAYSLPISSTAAASGNLGVINPSSGLTGSFSMAINNGTSPFVIPAGQTYYFQVIGNPLSTSGNVSVVTTIGGDSSFAPLGSSGLAAGANFVWSPNDNGISQQPGNDWTNGYGIAGLPANGLVQARGGTAPTPPTPITSAVPTGLTAICAPGGSQAILSWNAVPSATIYYPRVDDTANESAGCAAPTVTGPNGSCVSPTDYVGSVSSPSVTVKISNGNTYSWWVHSGVGSNPMSAAGIGSNFMCTSSLPPLPVAGSLSVSTDASTPGYQIVSGGTTGVVLGTFKFHASGEAVQLQKVRLTLDSTGPATPADLIQMNLYDGSTLVGTALFTGGQYGAITTLTQPVTVARDTDKTLTLKADISGARSGDLIKVTVDTGFGDTKGVGVSSGSNITATGNTSVTGVRVFKSYPTITLDSLNSTNVDFSTAKQPALIRFKVTASPSGSVGLGIIPVSISASGVMFGSVTAYAYMDSNYSQPIPGSVGGVLTTVNPSSGLTGNFSIPLSNNGGPIEVPAGQTYYFQIVGNNSNATGNIAVVTSLVSDPQFIGIGSYGANTTRFGANANFIWSPNDNSTSQFSDSDWTNGYQIQSLPITQTRTGSGTPTPTASFTSDATGSIASGSYATLQANIPAASSCLISGGIYGTGQSITLPTWSGWTGTLSQTTTFTLTCNTATYTTAVTVISAVIPSPVLTGTCSPDGTIASFAWTSVSGAATYLPFVQDYSNGGAYISPNIASTYTMQTSPYVVRVTPGHDLRGYIYAYDASGQQRSAPGFAAPLTCVSISPNSPPMSGGAGASAVDKNTQLASALTALQALLEGISKTLGQ